MAFDDRNLLSCKNPNESARWRKPQLVLNSLIRKRRDAQLKRDTIFIATFEAIIVSEFDDCYHLTIQQNRNPVITFVHLLKSCLISVRNINSIDGYLVSLISVPSTAWHIIPVKKYFYKWWKVVKRAQIKAQSFQASVCAHAPVFCGAQRSALITTLIGAKLKKSQ